MINAIINKIKEGSIKNVYDFSDIDTIPSPPYVIVRPENGPIPDTRQYRVACYMERGFFDELNNYVMQELMDLLNNKYLVNGEGQTAKVFCSGYSDVYPNPDDNTYFMERLFYIPQKRL